MAEKRDKPKSWMPQELTDDVLGEYEKILLYGAYGTGKTFLAATAPQPQYWLIIGPRNELKTLRSPIFKKKFGDIQMRYDFILEDETGRRGNVYTPRAYDSACDALDNALELREKGELPFETIVIENASTLIKAEMDKAIVLGSLGSSKDNKALERLKTDNIIQPADSDWGGAQSLMRKFVSWLYGLDTHLVFIAHERVESKKDRKTREDILLGVTPNFIGQQRQDIPALFDNVWRTSVMGRGESAVYEVDTVGDDQIFCKTRVGGVLREKETNLNLTNVIELFRSGMSREERIKASRSSSRTK